MRTKNFKLRTPRITLLFAAVAMSAISFAASIVLPATIELDDIVAAPAACMQARAEPDQPTH